MIQKGFFKLRPQILVRISKDDIIDQYDIFPIKIGEGNDAVVYKAKQNTDNGQWRAIKKIHRKYIQKEDYLNTQIDILKKLDHPGILKLYEIFDDSQYIFIVTQLCEGSSLSEQLRSKKRFKEKQAKSIFKRIIGIVQYCHQNKIIHRDLKLQNLVFASKSNSAQSLRLIDFGMSFKWQKNLRNEVKNTFTSNKMVGTIYYMAPEIFNQTYDHRVDIWSIGVILFNLLTGDLPFNQEEDNDIVNAIKQLNIPFKRLKATHCSQQAIDLLKKIFQNQHKRISIEQIMNHPWLQSDQLRLSKQTLHYFSLTPFKQFAILDDYYKYYKEKINQIALNTQHQYQDRLVSSILRTLNWNNVYEFLTLSPIQKAIKIHLSYRLSHEKCCHYAKIFDHFKTLKKQEIHIETLYQHLRLQYQEFLSNNDLIKQWQDQNLNTSLSHSKARAIKRKNSLNNSKLIYSVKKIYKQLLQFFSKNKHQFIGFTQFISWICDYNDFQLSELQYFRNQFHSNRQFSADNTPEIAIIHIHKAIKSRFLQSKQKMSRQKRCQTQLKFKINIVQPQMIHEKSHFSRNKQILNVKIQRKTLDVDQINLHHFKRKSGRKTIKQGILQSISPKFIKKHEHKQIKTHQYPKTDRPSKIQNKQQGGFLFQIQKIIQLW